MSSNSLKVLESPLFDKKLSFTIEEKNWISEASPCRTYITLKCKSSSYGFQIKKADKNTNATEISTSINIYENTLKQTDDVIGYFKFWEGAGKETTYPYPAYIESKIAVQSDFFKNLYKVLFQEKGTINITCEIKNLRDSNDCWETEKIPELLVRNVLISRREDSSDNKAEVFGLEDLKYTGNIQNRENNRIFWFIGRRVIPLIKKIF